MKDLKKKNRIAAFGAVLLSCILGLFGIMANQYLDVGADPSADTINGDTPLDISNKQAGILKNIMEAGDKFTVLEIVPYETASIFNVITGSEELRNRLASPRTRRKAAFHQGKCDKRFFHSVSGHAGSGAFTPYPGSGFCAKPPFQNEE